MKLHECPRCGRPTDGAWSEGGLRWAICEECMRKERGEGKEEMEAFLRKEGGK